MKALRSATSKAVANVLTKAREQRKLSQRDLAVLLKRPHSVVGMIETNQRQVNLPEFFAIAEALELDPTELFRQVVRERNLR